MKVGNKVNESDLGFLHKNIQYLRDYLGRQLGFKSSEMSSFSSLAKFLFKPSDPASLATVRILFGILMIFDIHHERGLSTADERWGDPLECRFPFVNFLKPLSLEWMCMLYFLMLIGAIGVTLGFMFHISCICFVVPYWFIFLLDKSRWNNHSYLFGLLALQLMVSDANRCWSLDGRREPEKRNTHVPIWNYILLRGQVFLVYFIAGLKKTDKDWVGGHSMDKLGLHWVFDGFRLFLTDDQITYFIVHLGGFLLDLTIGFFMFLDSTRPAAFVFCTSFNLMNSRMFAIGMFPYVMIAVMPVFCNTDWPKAMFCHLPPNMKKIILYDTPPKQNPRCIYSHRSPAKEKRNQNLTDHTKGTNKSDASFRQKMVAVSLCTYFATQGFLPYSHWITKGYNTWTLGLYGYSWDMMVHNWRYMHTKITVVDKETGHQFFLDPEAWTQNWRWTHHADMVKQFAHCVRNRLKTQNNITDIKLYVDVWISLNQRFTQRVYDPTVDIIAADWSPFREVTWVLPLLSDLSDWRKRLNEMEEKVFEQSNTVDVIFVTDFPGLSLINYVDKDLGNTTFGVLRGIVQVEFSSRDLIILSEGQSLKIPSGHLHKITPLHHKPACYMYTYVNTTQEELEMAWQNKDTSVSFPDQCNVNDRKYRYFHWKKKEGAKKIPSLCERNLVSLHKKYKIWKRSMLMLGRAFYSLLTGKAMSVEKSATDW